MTDAAQFPSLGPEEGPSGAPPPVSETLVAANKVCTRVCLCLFSTSSSLFTTTIHQALIERIRSKLSADDFTSFRTASSSFMQGDLPPDAYLQLAVSYGLVSLLPELMALCPATERRTALLHVYHAAFVQGDGEGLAAFVPPEAAAAACDHVATHAAWQCSGCGMVNSPEDARCARCTSKQPAAPAEEFPSLPASSAAPAAAKKKGKAVRMPLQDFVHQRTHAVNPRNVWTQQHPLKSGGGNQWAKAGGGQLAKELRAVQLSSERQ